MKEPAKGAIGRATAVAEGVAAGVRRRQREREPRVLLYARPGEPRVLAPGAKGHDRILEVAERMVALADELEGGGGRARDAGMSREDGSRRERDGGTRRKRARSRRAAQGNGE